MSDTLFLPFDRQEEAKNFWKKNLKGELSEVHLNGYKTKAKGLKNSHYEIEVDDILATKLINFSNNKDTVMYVIMLTTLKIMIYKLLGQKDIIVGSPVYNYSSNIYLYNSYIPIRSILNDKMTVEELINNLKQTVSQSYINQYFPISDLTDLLNIETDFSFYRVNMILENIHKIDATSLNLNTSLTDIYFYMVRDNNNIKCKAIYNPELFDEFTIKSWLKLYNHILQQVLNNTRENLENIDVLTIDDKTKILIDFNNTKVKYPNNKCIYEIFQEQVEKTPLNIAVRLQNEYLTYIELNEKSNQLASLLRKKGVKSDSIVAIMAEYSLNLLVGILAILKAGGAYLPIDTSFPIDRVNYILKDSETELLLTNYEINEQVCFNGEIININLVEINTEPTVNLETISNAKNLAYIIYTSGSTGVPKGTLIEHQGLVNYICWAKKMYIKQDREVFPLYSSIAFDLTITTIFTPIISGNEIIIYPENKDEYVLYTIIKEKKATVLKLTPSHLSLLKDLSNINSSVKRLIVGGENLKTNLAKKIYESFGGNIEIFNEYGPTETVVGCMIYKYNPEKDKGISIPIGKPADNVQIYILDKDQKPMPFGGIGEIYISGDGLSRGYLKKEELTSEKFIENPFIKGRKMYRTGDIAKWLPEYNIEYIDRIDNQLKIRGYRIELMEIEANILAYEGISDVTIILEKKENDTVELIAYIVAPNEISITVLNDYISEKLPHYMVPNHYIKIEKLPVTINGKVDKAALSNYKSRAIEECVLPENKMEKILLDICCDVLGVRSIGVNHNFFHIGGDSIKAILVSTQLQNLNLKLEISKIFEYPIIRDLSKFIEVNKKEVDQGVIEGEVKLTPIQYWFFNQNNTDINHYNQSIILHNKNGFDEIAVKKTFEKIIHHHDILRTVFILEEGQIVQSNKGLDCELFDYRFINFDNKTNYAERIEEVAFDLQRSINIEKGPLIKLGLFRTIDGDHLLIIMHHLIVDGVSWRIILEDFINGYKHLMNNADISFPRKTTSYREWAEKLYDYAQSKELLDEVVYWKRIEKQPISYLKKDNIVNERKQKDSEIVEISLSQEQTNKLLKEVNQAYNTEISDILLTALGLTVKEFISGDQVIVSLEGHGREEIISDVDMTRTVGWFTSIYPVVLDMSELNDISLQIRTIKETMRSIPKKGIGYGILKHLTVHKLKGLIDFTLKPEISFNYLGQFDTNITTDIFEQSIINSGQIISPYNERENALDITGMVIKGMLKLEFVYDRKEFKRETIQKYANNYKNNLLMIINHCSEKVGTEYTTHDLSDDEISLDELQDILNIVSEIEV